MSDVGALEPGLDLEKLALILDADGDEVGSFYVGMGGREPLSE